MDDQTAPIALFAFRRPAHLAETLTALAQSPLAARTEIFAFVDAPRDRVDLPAVDEVCRVLADNATSGRFKRLQVDRAGTPKGLARSVIDGLSTVLTAHERVIGLEDDIVMAPSALGFLNGALEAYASDPSVWSVSAFSPPLQMPASYDGDHYFSPRASSWGYATWRDRWQEVDWHPDHFRRLAADSRFRRTFALGGHDLPPMLDKQVAGEIDSWAVRWCARQAELGALTVYPVQSLVRNSGLDGSGTHSPVTDDEAVELGAWDETSAEFRPPMADPRIVRRFRRYYVSRTRLWLSRVWRLRHRLRRG